HAADVGGLGQLILDVLAGLRIEPRHAVAHHRAGPGLAVLVDDDVVGLRPGRRHDPFFDLLGLGVEHADRVAGVLRVPKPVLPIDRAAAWARIGDLAAPGRELAGLGIDNADGRRLEVEQIEIVAAVGPDAVDAEAFAVVAERAEIFPRPARDIEPQDLR